MTEQQIYKFSSDGLKVGVVETLGKGVVLVQILPGQHIPPSLLTTTWDSIVPYTGGENGFARGVV